VIAVQESAVRFTERRLAAGATTDLDNAQAISTLKQSLAALNLLQIERRLAQNQLCILMGIPVSDLSALLDSAPRRDIPVTPDFVVVGIPADLLRRRPDVRRAERLAAAQAEQIGIAVADLYPAFAINGTLGWQASTFSALFNGHSLNSNVGPAFQWNLLNYGRIRNNVRFQDALFRQLVAAYQNAVLQADLEVENGIINFLQSQERAKSLNEAVLAAQTALDVVVAQYQAEVAMAQVDFNRYTVIVQTLIQQQDQWAQARGQIAQGLIETYRALGGGWQLRLGYAPDNRGILSADAVLVQPEGVAAPAGEALPRPAAP
jgi:outer membrane protein TolC